MRDFIAVLAAAALLAGVPGGLAAHGQMSDGLTQVFAFHPDLFSDRLIVDWIGIGGSGGDGSDAAVLGFDGDELELQNPEPDDCADFDEIRVDYGAFHFGFPSLAFKIINQPHSNLVPGQSVAAPPALLLLCAAVRENLNNQAPGYQYATASPAVGFGNVTNEASSFALPIGTFINNGTFGNGTALVFTFEGRVCHISGFAGTSSHGSEPGGLAASTNGVLDPPATADSCVDITDAVVEYLTTGVPGEPSDWDPGAINEGGGRVLFDNDLYANNIAFGLNAVCFQADVVDWTNSQFGFFEDYAFFWVEGPGNLFANAPDWSQANNSDGFARGQDCSSIGIVA